MGNIKNTQIFWYENLNVRDLMEDRRRRENNVKFNLKATGWNGAN
jgi:hypothetical protein